MQILEDHNKQLEAQLLKLRQLLNEPNASSPSKTGTLQTRSVTASQLATDSTAKMNGHYHEFTAYVEPDTARGRASRSRGSIVKREFLLRHLSTHKFKLIISCYFAKYC